MSMKTNTLELTLTVKLDPNGADTADLQRNLKRIVKTALDSGTVSRRRQPGEHYFADCGGIPRCVTCGCDEDDAFVGGEECSYGT
jgi:hypothetical protein